MKKIDSTSSLRVFIAMAALVCSMSVNAQTMKIMKGDKVVATYTAEQADKVVFEEASAPAVDANLLPGEFSVSATKTVQFSKSNLYWDGSAFKFEANQTDYPTSWDASHVSHFYWTKTAASSYAESYSDGTNTTSDVPFFAESQGGLTVEGTSGLFVLKIDEWSYLISSRTDATNLSKYGQTVGGKTNCLLIAPDGFDTSKWHSSNSYTLEEVNSLGLVCLPAAGYRNGSYLYDGGVEGYYWYSSPAATYIKYVGSDSDSDYDSIEFDCRGDGSSLRLVALPQ